MRVNEGRYNPIYREYSISQSHQEEDCSVVCVGSEISWILLLWDERQMSTRCAYKIQSQALKSRLKELTSRSNGWEHAKRKQKQKEYIRGWVGSYHLANETSLA